MIFQSKEAKRNEMRSSLTPGAFGVIQVRAEKDGIVTSALLFPRRLRNKGKKIPGSEENLLSQGIPNTKYEVQWEWNGMDSFFPFSRL